MCQSLTLTDKRCLQSNFKTSWRMYGCRRVRARFIVSHSVCIIRESRGREREKREEGRENVVWAEPEPGDGSE